VVYLPGPGAGAQAGALWRQAWTRAGYAVLSLQPLDSDARLVLGVGARGRSR